jgi:phage virion morphogenesis protein
MTAFTVEIHDAPVRAILNQLAAKVGNLQPVFQSIGEDIMERANQRFVSGTGPDGQRWKPNAASTIQAYIAAGGKGAKKPLIGLSKSLMNQFHIRADTHSVTVGNSMIYAAIQQFGGTIESASRSQLSYFKRNADGSVGNRFVRKSSSDFAQWHTRGAHKITIPARPFLPVRQNGTLYPEDQAKILAALNSYLLSR